MCFKRLLKNSYLWIKSHNDIFPKVREGYCSKQSNKVPQVRFSTIALNLDGEIFPPTPSSCKNLG